MFDELKSVAVLSLPASGGWGESEWKPLVDVYRTRGGWILKFDLAGVRPDDVAVRILGCRVTVAGIRRDLTLEEGYVYHSLEISYSRFERTIDLPCDLASARFTVEYRDGFLLVRVCEGETK